MKSLFSLRGRTSRLGYWRAYLLSAVLIAVFWALGLLAILTIGPAGGVLLAGIVPAIALILATTLRRLHDRGKNVWWWALFMVGPFMCAAVANLLVSRETPAAALASLPFSLGALGLGVWGLVEIGFLRGDPRPNRYGDVPSVGR